MDDDTLRHFLNIARTLHFGRASRESHISPSALSRSMQRLETEVGTPLLERDQRGVRLTREGSEFQAFAAETLQKWQTLRARLRGEDATLTGTIAIFASVTACQSFLPRTLSAFRAAFPDIHIRLETGNAADALAMLTDGKVDVTVAALPQRVPATLVARPLLFTPLVFVAPVSDCEASRLCAQRVIPWADVPLVWPAAGLARQSADRWFRRRRVVPRVYSEVVGSEAILSLVALGCGVGIVPRLVAEKSPLRTLVREVEVQPQVGEFRVGVCTARSKLRSSLVRAFWDSVEGESAGGLAR